MQAQTRMHISAYNHFVQRTHSSKCNVSSFSLEQSGSYLETSKHVFSLLQKKIYFSNDNVVGVDFKDVL